MVFDTPFINKSGDHMLEKVQVETSCARAKQSFCRSPYLYQYILQLTRDRLFFRP